MIAPGTTITVPVSSGAVATAAAPAASAGVPQYQIPAPPGSYGFTDHGYFRPDGGWTQSPYAGAAVASARAILSSGGGAIVTTPPAAVASAVSTPDVAPAPAVTPPVAIKSAATTAPPAIAEPQSVPGAASAPVAPTTTTPVTLSTPSVAAPAAIHASATSAGASIASEAAAPAKSTRITGSAPIVLIGMPLSATVTSQTRGAWTTWTAHATGGIAPYAFEWQVFEGGRWRPVAGWTGSPTYVSPVTTPRSVRVRVRDAAGQEVAAAR
jgi:hypothetical protein